MGVKNILIPGRRQRIRSEVNLTASRISYENSCRNLKYAKITFWITLFVVIIKICIFVKTTFFTSSFF